MGEDEQAPKHAGTRLVFHRGCGICRVLMTADGSNKPGPNPRWLDCKHQKARSQARAASWARFVIEMVQHIAANGVVATESKMLGFLLGEAADASAWHSLLDFPHQLGSSQVPVPRHVPQLGMPLHCMQVAGPQHFAQHERRDGGSVQHQCGRHRLTGLPTPPFISTIVPYGHQLAPLLTLF